jgi:hypothetical protein
VYTGALPPFTHDPCNLTLTGTRSPHAHDLANMHATNSYTMIRIPCSATSLASCSLRMLRPLLHGSALRATCTPNHLRIIHLPATDLHGITTGEASFAECLTHSAKQHKHSAKSLPSVALKGLFAECFLWGTRQRLCRAPNPALGKKNGRDGGRNGDGYLPSAERSTQQSVCSLPSILGQHWTKCMLFAEC